MPLPFQRPNGNESLRDRTLALQPGTGTRLTANALGYTLSLSGGGRSFAHPWKPALSGMGLRMARGVVMDMQGGKGIEPLIKGVRVGGEPGRPQPVLPLDPGAANQQGESWACVEVTPDADGALVSPSQVVIVHVSHPTFSGKPEVGRHPLALIVWQNGKPSMCLAIAHFHLRYLHWQPPAGAGQVRHFFL